MKKNTFLKKQQPPEPIHLMTEVTSILGSICKKKTSAVNKNKNCEKRNYFKSVSSRCCYKQLKQ